MRPSRHGVGAALFVLLLAVQMLNFSGVPHSSDGIAMLATSESLVRRGDLDMNAYLWMGLQQGSFGPDGELYSRKGLGQSLAALPFAWLGLKWEAVGLIQASMLLGPLVAAATGWLLYHCVLALGYSMGAALAASLALGLATPVLPYGKYFFSDPLTGLALLGAFAAWLLYRRRRSAGMAAAVGAALGFAALTRTTSLALVPVFGLALWWARADLTPLPPFPEKEGGPSLPGRKGGPGITAPPSLVRKGGLTSLLRLPQERGPSGEGRLGDLVAFGAGLGALVLLMGWSNWVRFGNPLTSGYLPQESFSGDLVAGVAGLLVSPGRGLLLYAPVLLMAIPGWVSLRRRDAGSAWVVLGVFALHVLIYGKWFMWHGGYCWGPRFLLPTLPFLALTLGPIWERGGAWRKGFLTLAALSLLPQVLGSLVHFSPFQDDLLGTGLPLFDPRTFWDPAYSPLLRQWAYIRPETLDFAWAQGVGAAGVDWLSLAALLASAAVAALALWRCLRRPAGALVGLAALAVVGVGCLALVRAHGDGRHPLDPLLTTVEARERADDVILSSAPADSLPISDRYGGQLPAYGTPDSDEGLLEELSSRYDRVWVLSSPEVGGLAEWLGDAYPALTDGNGDRRLSLFLLAREPLAARRIDQRLGDGVILGEVATLARGDDLLVRLTWMAEDRPSGDYKVFVHVLDRSGALLAQSDSVPANWTRPTTSWAEGEHIEDRHGLLLPDGAEAWLLRVGLYQQSTRQRLVLPGGVDAVDIELSP